MADIKEIANAIETIKSLVFCGNCTTGDCKNCNRFKAKQLAIEALRKQITKKPIIKKVYPSKLDEPYCPCCNEPLSYDDKFCSECGQALDWSDE